MEVICATSRSSLLDQGKECVLLFFLPFSFPMWDKGMMVMAEVLSWTLRPINEMSPIVVKQLYQLLVIYLVPPTPLFPLKNLRN